jgi:hypothetical protein
VRSSRSLRAQSRSASWPVSGWRLPCDSQNVICTCVRTFERLRSYRPPQHFVTTKIKLRLSRGVPLPQPGPRRHRWQLEAAFSGTQRAQPSATYTSDCSIPDSEGLHIYRSRTDSPHGGRTPANAI